MPSDCGWSVDVPSEAGTSLYHSKYMSILLKNMQCKGTKVTHQPQLDEGRCNRCDDEEAVQEWVEEEEHEELVVGESNTVIQPEHAHNNTQHTHRRRE